MTQPIINVNITIAAPVEDPNTVRIPVTNKKGEIKYFLVDREDFDRVNEYKWRIDARSYVRKGFGIFLHRFIMGIIEPKMVVDHVNGDKLDNRKANLRIVTNTQNAQNKKKQVNNTSGFKGVFFNKTTNKCVAQIRINGKCKYLGNFSTPEAAAHAYDEAARIYHGEFGRYNFPREGERSAI